MLCDICFRKDTGITLVNTRSVNIENNIIQNPKQGINVEESQGILIIDNIVNNTLEGLTNASQVWL